jgi:hypothetical protein
VVFQTLDHCGNFGARRERFNTDIGCFDDWRFQSHIVLQVFCEFGFDEFSPGGETE